MPLRFTLRQLEYFVAVGETGGIAAASEVVNVSSPSISAAISQLEQELSAQLFVRRHAQGLTLTPGGRELFCHAKRVLAEAEGLGDLAASLNLEIGGRLRVGCLISFAHLVLPELRRTFQDAQPRVVVTQYERHQGDLLQMLTQAEVDVAITYDLDLSRALSFEPLAKLPPYAMLPAGHPLTKRRRLTVAELADEPLILLDLPVSADYFLSLFRDAGVEPRIAERTRDLAVMRSMVANGFGYGLANMRQQTDLAPDGKPLRSVPLSEECRPLMLGLASLDGGRRTRTLQAFVDHCRAHFTGRLTQQRSVG